MAEIYLVPCEYTLKDKGIFETSQAGYSTSYEKAKERLHKCVKEEMDEGNIPQGYDGWNETYEDFFTYENKTKKLLYYVCAVDNIEDL